MRTKRALSLFALLLVLPRCTQDDSPAEMPAGPVADLAGPPAGDLRGDPPDAGPRRQYNRLFIQRGAGDFSAWARSGVAVVGTGAEAGVALSPSKNKPLTCLAGDVDGGAASYDPTTGLCAGKDPLPKGGYTGGQSYYNGGDFYYGTLVSPEIDPGAPIDHVIASWNAATPAGTWIEVHLRLRMGGGWTRWYVLPIWASDFSTINRHSVDGQADGSGGVDTDTFAARAGQAATAYQLGVTLFSTTPALSPSVRLIAALASRDEKAYPALPGDPAVWGTDLPVPQRSQALPEYRGLGYGGGGEVWCSPTSTSMVMAYWAGVLGQADLDQKVPDAAAGTYDSIYKGTGNWPFNTAYAASYGLTGVVTRLYSMSQAEAWIKAGVPLVISIGFGPGELPGAPISKTNGHLIVVRGFSKAGDVITNDPAAPTDAKVQITYPRAALENAWSHSQRTAYLIYPAGRPVPER